MLLPGFLESIVVQLKPGGKELIILRFSGIIEQMCFEIGRLTIAVPPVIASNCAVVYNRETEEKRQTHHTVHMKNKLSPAHNNPPPQHCRKGK